MRSIARAAACGAALALSSLSFAGTAGAASTGTTGGAAVEAAAARAAIGGVPTAPVAPSTGSESVYAPSALVLAVTDGADHTTGTVRRAVTLSCAPTPSGSHPDPVAACSELKQNGAKFDTVTASATNRVCTKEWEPVTVTADGVWDGQRVAYAHTFANSCAMDGGRGAVFTF
ncbi:subtilase-type protease inhibitor [Streptomyces sp. NBC_01498]|uniref:subtilase-type protease inhibitor n=1 Tax=Streptomyces sp. NBC_01498 TaxID=2975870 RepID=UPI002E7AF3B6|nr:subtilase-type protease inhibitor [Streptomyces sp. NBC_01498]WTL28265.1 subtilase-type protease inhibitor [Streptomyces sp. NBC_01498]